jgi:hypothetical protein
MERKDGLKCDFEEKLKTGELEIFPDDNVVTNSGINAFCFTAFS